MNLIFLQICVVVIVQIHQVCSKPLNSEIDEFINRLLSSNKFDELANKIADKAAKKIFDLDNRLSSNIKVQKDETTKKSLRENSFKNDQHSKEGKQNVASRRDNELVTKQTVLRKKPRPKENLRLKYKNFSKGSRGHSNKKKNILETENEDMEGKINEPQSTRGDGSSEITTKKVTPKNRYIKVGNKPTSANKIKMKSKSDVSAENTKHSVEGKNDEDADISENDKKANTNEEKSKSLEEKENKSNANEHHANDIELDDENNEDKSDQHIKSIENTESQNRTVSTENDNKNYNPSNEKRTSIEDSPKPRDGRETEPDSEKEKESEEKEKNIRKSFTATTRKLIIRREGDKLYAFENLPDYHEYQEKIKKQKVDQKEIVLKY